MNQAATASNKLMADPQSYLAALDFPALLMQGEPRQVVTANSKACELFGKNLSQIEGHRVVF